LIFFDLMSSVVGKFKRKIIPNFSSASKLLTKIVERQFTIKFSWQTKINVLK
jgi:hypothetical protein